MTLCNVLVLASFSGSLSAAYAFARHAGDNHFVIGGALVLGLLAGIATCIGLNRIGAFLLGRSSLNPGQPPTFRDEFPFMLMYAGTVVGIIASVTLTSWLVRFLAVQHVT